MLIKMILFVKNINLILKKTQNQIADKISNCVILFNKKAP